MAAYEVLLLNTSIPQIQAAQAGDTYVVPRDIAFSANTTFSANTANGILYLNASKVASTSSGLTFDGTTATINTLNLTNALGAIYGGTGLTSYTTGDLIYSSATNTLSKLAIGLNTYILTSNGTAPVWAAPSSVVIGTATNLAGGAAGSVPYQSGASTTTFLSIGAANRVMTSTGSAPQWATSLTGLTGVSSSSITNTSLTAGRVVYSTTGGAQTDSAALTFDGTTLATTTVDATNLEVTNIKALDGTAAMSIANSTGVVSVTANPVLSGGTANGVLYLNASKVATSGSALTFDGTEFGTTSLGVNINNASALVRFQNGSGTRRGYIQVRSDAYEIWSDQAAVPMVFGTANTEKLRITSGGQVNIGGNFTSTNNTLQVTGNAAIGYTTAAPTTGLIVAGNVGIGASSPQGPLEVAATGATVNQFLTGGVGNNAVTGIFRIGSGTGRGASIQGFRGASSNIHSLDFYSYNAADVFGMRLDPSGNLGIGETNPTYKLEVNGGASDAMSLFNSTNANGAHLRFAASGTVKSYIGGAPGFLGSGTADDLGIRAVGSILFATAGSGVDMTLDSAGYLGIGTTTPQTQVHISGAGTQTLSLERTGAAVPGRFEIISGNNTNLLRAVTAKPLVFEQGTGVPVMYLDTAGNLGLGVTPSAWGSNHKAINMAAASTSHLVATVNPLSTGTNYYNNNTNFLYATTGQLATRYAQNTGQHQWFTAASGTAGNAISFSQAMTLDASGNLGVGTTSIGARLDVQSANVALASDGLARIGSDSSGADTGGQITFGNNNARRAAIAGRQEGGGALAGYLQFGTRGTSGDIVERARITSGGNFGIGVTNPTYTLDVTGSTSTARLGKLTITNDTPFLTGANLDAGAQSFALGTSGAGIVAFFSNNTERARITSGGDFRVKGAGTAGSTDAFQISGSAPADAARLTSGGDFLVGTTSGIGRIGAAFPNVQYGFTASCTSASGTAIFNRFLYNTSTEVGTISSTGSSTAYNTSSDYRLKDNQQPLTGSGAFIDALKPKTWDWKSGGKGVGFIAHEVQAVSPGSVVGEKDAVDADGKPIMQAMEYGSAEFIANIIAELQSLRARVAQLEAK